MSQVGEAAVIIDIEDPGHDEKTCYFCSASASEKRENELTPSDEDTLETYKFHNSSRTLRRRLKDAGEPATEHWLKPVPGGYKEGTSSDHGALVIGLAAHHLIPGEAAFAPSRLYVNKEHYLGVDGAAEGNIGYNINSAKNGVWAPSHFAISGWGEGGSGFSGNAQHYAFAAIRVTKTQFHDGHSAYSESVLEALNRLADKVDAQEMLCPHVAQKDAPRAGMVTLVMRLDGLSASCLRMVKNPSGQWKSNAVLSPFSRQYITTFLK